MKEYAKPRLKKHGALKQVTFSGSENKVTFRAAWRIETTNSDGETTVSAGAILPAEEAEQLRAEGKLK